MNFDDMPYKHYQSNDTPFATGFRMHDSAQLSHWLSLATKIAHQAGTILKKYWGNLQSIQEKDFPGDLVTEADKQSEQFIVNALQKKFTSHQILAEESGLFTTESEFIWVVDPLDGTTNYAHQYPMVAISIALLHQHIPLIGIVYNPLTEEFFSAAQGLGAYLNQKPIRVSNCTSLKDSLLATGFAYDRRETQDNNYAEFCRFTHLTQGVRRAGSAALDLAYVACGRLDGYWERGLRPWDIAAGTLLVQEAGGRASSYNLDPIDWSSGRILASNSFLHEKMSQELLFPTQFKKLSLN